MAVEEPTASVKWADISMDEDEDDFAPQPDGAFFTVLEDGVKQYTQYVPNEEDKTVKKVTRKVKEITTVTKVNLAVFRRQSMTPFGQDGGEGDEAQVVQSNEDIFIEAPKVVGFGEREEDEKFAVAVDLVIPSLKKQELRNKFKVIRDADDALKAASKQPTESEASTAPTTTASSEAPTPATTKYVMPAARRDREERGRGGGGFGNYNDEATVRVTNLSEDVSEADLIELFDPAGKILRVYLAKNKDTRNSIGFAFITFASKEHVDRAIELNHRRGYDNMILNVERSKPTTRTRERS